MKFNFAITGVSVKVPEVQVASTDLFGGMDVVMGQNEFVVQGVQFGAEISGAELFDVVGAASVQTSNLLEHAKDIYEYVTEDTTINRLVKAVNQIEEADTNLSIKTLANKKLVQQASKKFSMHQEAVAPESTQEEVTPPVDMEARTVSRRRRMMERIQAACAEAGKQEEAVHEKA